MADALATTMPVRFNRAPLWGTGAILVALVLLGLNLRALLPGGDWLALLSTSSDGDFQLLIAHNVLLPRFVVALCCGAGLGLAGVLFQQVLRNPLAEPGTLGVFAGAKCALVVVTIWMPGALVLGWDVIALCGGGAATAIVLALAARHSFAPLSVILSGLVVSLCLGSLGSMLMMTHFDAVGDLYLWEAGSLVQNSWAATSTLLPRLVLAALVTLLLARRLALLDLEEEGARSLGLPLLPTRLFGLSIAVIVSATIAGLVGLIGFIGLAGPAIARHSGARLFRERLLAGPLIGGGLLAMTDQLLVFLAGGAEIPAGAVSALLGAPLLIWVLREVRARQAPGAIQRIGNPSDLVSRPSTLVPVLLLLAAIAVALMLGRDPQGWHVAWGQDFTDLLPWRLPRVAAAAAAGSMLALAGLFIQRTTGNPLASPELLGISSGAGIFLVLAAFFLPAMDRTSMAVLASLGAFGMLTLVLWLTRRSSFSPEHMLLTGIALGSIMASMLTYLTILGDPRVLAVLGWLSGSTYAVTLPQAAFACIVAVAALALAPLLSRWLAILPLGRAVGRELGVPERSSRLLLVIATAVLTGVATVLAGPLSFVGLVGPHLARLCGFRRPVEQAYAAAFIGAIVMVGADWIGRTIAFPWQVPAGFVSTVMGGAFYIALLARR